MKLLSRVLIYCLVATGSAVPTLSQENKAQTKPDLSGTWKLDPSKSNAGEIGKRDAPIKIVYHDPELIITRTFVRNGQPIDREFVYYTDGRGETNGATILLTSEPGRVKPEDIEKQDVRSRTKWEHNRIVIRTTIESRVDRYSLRYLLIEEWKISADGKSLTQTSRFQPDPMTPTLVPANRPDQKRFYVLVSK